MNFCLKMNKFTISLVFVFAISFANAKNFGRETQKRFFPIETFYRQRMPEYVLVTMGRRKQRNNIKQILDVPFPSILQSREKIEESDLPESNDVDPYGLYKNYMRF